MVDTVRPRVYDNRFPTRPTRQRRRKPAPQPTPKPLQTEESPLIEPQARPVITVEMPNGAKLEFPEGTPHNTIVETSRRIAGQIETETAKPAEPQTDSAVGRGLERAGTAVANVAKNAYGAFMGQQDPNFEGVDAITEYGVATPGAKHFAISDDAYHDVLKKNLGDRYISTQTDANGYKIINYRDAKTGQPTRGYVNQPGADWQDLDRGISAALPFVAGGAAANAVTRGLPAAAAMIPKAGKYIAPALSTLTTPVGRGLTQAATAAGVSVGADNAATEMGSEQGVDWTRAGLAGATGGLGSVIPLTVAGAGVGGLAGAASGETTDDMMAGGLAGLLAGGLAGRGAQKMLTRKIRPQIEDGRLASPEARAAAQKAGLNPDELDEHTAQMIANNVNAALDPTELGIASQTGKFNIPTTKGQRTKSPQLLSIEKDARYGSMGDDALTAITNFDKRQAAAIESAAFDDGVGRALGGNFADKGTTVATRGARVQSGLNAAKDAADDAASGAWKAADDIIPTSQGLQTLPEKIVARVGDFPVDDTLTPTAARMVKDLDQFMSGKLTTGLKLGGAEPQVLRSASRMRKRLLSAYKGADNNTDRAASKAVYDGYNQWIDDIAEQGFMTGRPEAAAALRTAREFTRETKMLWSPTDRRGRMTPVGRILEGITEKADSPEAVITAILGSGGPGTAPKTGSVEALKHIKHVLFKPRPGAGIDEGLATQTWNDIRMAYWSKLVLKKDGKMHTPHMVAKGIREAHRNQNSMLSVLYTRQEQQLMREYGRAVSAAVYTDPNPSGTAAALRAAQRKEGAITGSLRTFLQTQSKRELFSKHNVVMSRIYQLLAKRVPVNLAGSKDAMGAAAVKRSLDGRMTAPLPPDRGGVVAAGGVGALEMGGRQR